jgi:glutathione S-transferase
MKMKLYFSQTSPYARKVRVTVIELGIENLIEEIEVNPYVGDPALLAVNPLSKIPTLVTEHGESLPDSRLIFSYLLSRGRGLATLPHGSPRWKLLRRLQYGDGIIDAAVACYRETVRPPEQVSAEFAERQQQAIRRTLAVLESEADQLRLSDEVGSCEISIGCALGYLDLRLPQLDWRKDQERLAQWFAVFGKRPSMVATQPPGVS